MAAPWFGVGVGGSGWSVGPLEDLLWGRLPELRVTLARLVADELERAVEMDRVVWRLSGYETCSLFMSELFRPALDGLPATDRLARACGRAPRELMELDGVLGGSYWDPVRIRVLEWLAGSSGITRL